jgi:hypothetical protein
MSQCKFEHGLDTDSDARQLSEGKDARQLSEGNVMTPDS